MKVKAFVRISVAFFVVAFATLAATVSVSRAEAAKSYKPGSVALPAAFLNDPAIREKIFGLLELADRAKTQPAALQQLLALREQGKEALAQEEMFEMFGQRLSGTAAVAAEDLKNRNRFGRVDSSAQYQGAAAAGLVPYRSPAPAFSRNLLITRDLGTPIQTEPHVCVNPNDPNNVIVAATDYGLPYTSMYASFDAGETWKGPQRVPLTDRAVFGGDPVLTCGRDESAHEVFMSLGYWEYEVGPWPLELMRSDIAVSASADGGLNWKQPTVVATNMPRQFTVQVSDPSTGKKFPVQILVLSFLDKPWITSGPNPTKPGKDALYASYTEFKDYIIVLNVLGFVIPIPLQSTSAIAVHSSLDSGKTWQLAAKTKEVQAIPEQGEAISDLKLRKINYQYLQGSQVKVGNDGSLYLAWYSSGPDGGWYGNDQIVVAKTPDAGKTWVGPVMAADVLEMAVQPRSASFRTNGSSLPQMALGPKGEIYLVFTALTKGKPTDDGDIYFVSGMQKGNTLVFQKPRRLNQEGTDKLQFFPAIATSPNGTINVMWGDMRDDPAGLKYHIYYTQSKNGGKTWGFVHQGIRENDTRVTDFYSNPNKGFPRGEFIGDYFAIAASNSDAYLVWSDTRLGEYGGINQKVAFARRSAIPSPEIYLNPGRGSMAQEVTVQASNFQPDMEIYVRIGDTIVSKGKTDLNGGAQFNVHMPPADTKGISDVDVFDESGNLATASYYNEVGYSDFAKSADVKNDIAHATTTLSSDLRKVNNAQAQNALMLYIVLGILGSGIVGGAGFFLRRKLRKNAS